MAFLFFTQPFHPIHPSLNKTLVEMKKTILFSHIMLILSCQKAPFEVNSSRLKQETLPTEFIGQWRWQYSVGGFTGSQKVVDSTKSILTLEPN